MAAVILSRRGLWKEGLKAAVTAVVGTSPIEIAAQSISGPNLSPEAYGRLGANMQRVINSLDSYAYVKRNTSAVREFMKGKVAGPMNLDVYDGLLRWAGHLNELQRAGHSMEELGNNLRVVRELYKTNRGFDMHPEMAGSITEIPVAFREMFGSHSISGTIDAINNRVLDWMTTHFEYLATLPVEQTYNQYPAWWQDVVRGIDRNGSRGKHVFDAASKIGALERQIADGNEQVTAKEKSVTVGGATPTGAADNSFFSMASRFILPNVEPIATTFQCAISAWGPYVLEMEKGAAKLETCHSDRMGILPVREDKSARLVALPEESLK